jgi:hypothetical protein
MDVPECRATHRKHAEPPEEAHSQQQQLRMWPVEQRSQQTHNVLQGKQQAHSAKAGSSKQTT